MRKFRFDMGWGRLGSKGIYQPETWKELVGLVSEQAAGKGFFLMANTSLTHAPWQVKLVNNGISTDPEDRLAPPTTVDWKKIPVHPFLPDTEVARKDLARYFAMVQLVDDWTRVLVDALEKSGLADSTLVIFTPDHGMPYQRGKVACYPAGTQIPLIIVGPGVKKGVRIDAPVSHVDLMATILEFLEIEAPEVQHGRSLWPILRGEVDSFHDRKTILTETNSWYKARAVTDGRWYYVRNFTQPFHQAAGDDPWSNPPMNIDLWLPTHQHYDNQVYTETIRAKEKYPLAYELLAQIVEGRLPEEELYDLENDPWATRNLAGDKAQKEVLNSMRRELKIWQKKTNDPLLNRKE
jgi:N-sulfoglucosamine sulfohydrolase